MTADPLDAAEARILALRAINKYLLRELRYLLDYAEGIFAEGYAVGEWAGSEDRDGEPEAPGPDEAWRESDARAVVEAIRAQVTAGPDGALASPAPVPAPMTGPIYDATGVLLAARRSDN